MSHFSLISGELHAEDVALTEVAERFGTPCYVYSRAALADAYFAYREALADVPAEVCYAVKANSNIAILNLFASFGAGFDIVSGGELARVLVAGGDPAKVLFSGVGKNRGEMEDALDAGIRCFNVESVEELETLNEVALAHGTLAPVALRVNPNVDPKTHPYISTGLKTAKFGVPIEEARDIYRRAADMKGLRISGIDCHIGSQLLDPAPAAEAATKVVELAERLADDGIAIDHFDLGGGMGISYREDRVPTVAEYLAPTLNVLKGRKEHLLFEPGRSLVGNAGVLLTRIERLKHGSEKNFAVIDAAMNDLMRPALYDAWHEIVKVSRGGTAFEAKRYDVVGPICESGDFLGQARDLAVTAGDLLAVMSAGAYGMAMSSNYNTRPRAAEVMVDGDQMHLIRRRENVEELFAAESLLP